nr:Putative uncharacterized protein [Moritella viscosa]SHO18857.1 Putative uncharacterized protein [Moritella viscosa]
MQLPLFIPEIMIITQYPFLPQYQISFQKPRAVVQKSEVIRTVFIATFDFSSSLFR